MKTFTSKDVGCYFDCARGIYIGEAVQHFASAYGWTGEHAKADVVYYNDAWDDAEAYLNGLTSDDVYFGGNENGDWGLWPIEEDK